MRHAMALVSLLSLCLCFVQPALAGEVPKGAKALFGEGMEEIFYPPEEDSRHATDMNPSANVAEDQLTGFYKTPAFPGVAYSMEMIRRGEQSIVTVEDPRRYEFKTGDRLRLRLVPNFSGFAYVMENKAGDTNLVYPVNYGSKENLVTAGRECYVPTNGWLKLVDPAEPFTMRVLFNPGSNDYPLNRPESHPAVTRVALTNALAHEWEVTAGRKGFIFEADRSYVDVQPALAVLSADPAPAVDREDYTTTYVVLSEEEREQSAIAIEVPIQHVRR